MKLFFNKAFISTLIFIAIVAIIISMIAGPIGQEAISIGASFSAILFAGVVIIFGLFGWKKKRK